MHIEYYIKNHYDAYKKTVDIFFLRTAHTQKNCRRIFFMKCVDNLFLNLATKN